MAVGKDHLVSSLRPEPSETSTLGVSTTTRALVYYGLRDGEIRVLAETT